MKSSMILFALCFLLVPVLPGQTWEVTLLESQGSQQNNITADQNGVPYTPGTYVFTDAKVGALDIGTKGKPVYVPRSTFNFAVRNPFPRTSPAVRTMRFTGFGIDANHPPKDWNDLHACLYPGLTTLPAVFPGCLADFINSYNYGIHPGMGYSSAGLWLYLPDFDFLNLSQSDPPRVFSTPTARLNIYEPGDCVDPVQSGIGFIATTAFPAGLTGSTKVTRTGVDTWLVEVDQPLAMMVFLQDRVTIRNKTTCQIISSSGAGPIWTTPVRFSMTWTRKTY